MGCQLLVCCLQFVISVVFTNLLNLVLYVSGAFFPVILQGHLLDYCRSARSKESQNSRKSKSSSHHSGSRRAMMPGDRPKKWRRKKPRIHDPLHKSRSPSSQRLPHGRCSRDRSRSPFITSGSHRRCVFSQTGNLMHLTVVQYMRVCTPHKFLIFLDCGQLCLSICFLYLVMSCNSRL